MSDAPAKKRCPNCAWAFWHARALKLPTRERMILFAIAERADADLHCAPTQVMLCDDTGMSARVISEAVQSLAARKNCIRLERQRDGWHYFLLRPLEDQSKPAKPEWHGPWYDDVADSDLRISQVSEVVTHQELRDLRVPAPKNDEIRISGPAKSADPSNDKNPLEESPKEETSLRSVACASAPATPETTETNVVVLSVVNEAQQVVEAWNAMAKAHDLPRLRVGETARRKASALIRKHGIADVLRAIEAVAGSSHCTGSNDRGWKADFYFLGRSEKFERLLTGYYTDRPGRVRARPGTHAAFQQQYGLGAMQPTFDPEPDDAGRIAQ